jgi:hypothetical protein
MQIVVTLIMLGLFGAYYVWMMKKRTAAMASMGPAIQLFFERTGYRYPNMPAEPIQAHLDRANTDMKAVASGGSNMEYVRNFGGMPIAFAQRSGSKGNTYFVSCSWRAQLPTPARVPFQIADKSLDSTMKAVTEAFSNSKRVWNAQFPTRVQTGIPEVDSKYVVYGNDAQAVTTAIRNSAALIALLGQCVEVDLCVGQSEAVFADPMQTNMNAAMGGMVGNMALGFDMQKRLELSIPIHDRIADILMQAARAAA